MAETDPRKTRQWKRVRARVLKGATLCELPGCQGPPLDFDAPALSRWAPSVDHITPLHDGGEPFDLRNLRPVHLGCNSSRGNMTRRTAVAPANPSPARATWW